MENETILKAGEIIAKNAQENGYCTLALIDLEGYPTASTISASKNDGINWITFCTGLHWPKSDRIRKCNRASVCFNSIDHNITLVGTIELITDQEVKNEMWCSDLSDYFKGPNDPDYCVLRFETKRYNIFADSKEAVGTL